MFSAVVTTFIVGAYKTYNNSRRTLSITFWCNSPSKSQIFLSMVTPSIQLFLTLSFRHSRNPGLLSLSIHSGYWASLLHPPPPPRDPRQAVAPRIVVLRNPRFEGTTQTLVLPWSKNRAMEGVRYRIFTLSPPPACPLHRTCIISTPHRRNRCRVSDRKSHPVVYIFSFYYTCTSNLVAMSI